MISYYSTNHKVKNMSLADALLSGQAPDKGLFMPDKINPLSKSLLKEAKDLSYPELATKILAPFAEGTFSFETLEEICHDAYDFDIPLEKVTDYKYIMRLDQGPTASFKDFAAKFMGRALGKLVSDGKELLILTATSGDTGSAIAHAFHNVPNIKLVVLFPIKEVSDRQRKQMTTLGDNVSTIAVNGQFDDCQAIVKQAFADDALKHINLSSANSINIGRLLPQSVYYVYAASRLVDLPGEQEIIFSIPSGNFGDMMGGVLSKKYGLPISKFIIATNANDEVPLFFKTGKYKKISPSKICISNAMNVGHPSNLARLVDVYGGEMDETGKLVKAPDMEKLREDFYAISIDDDITRKTIKVAWDESGTMLEPHGSVGWAGLLSYLASHPEKRNTVAVSLETAHPAKFPDEIMALTSVNPPVPKSLEGLDDKKEQYDTMEASYSEFQNLLIKEYSR